MLLKASLDARRSNHSDRGGLRNRQDCKESSKSEHRHDGGLCKDEDTAAGAAVDKVKPR